MSDAISCKYSKYFATKWSESKTSAQQYMKNKRACIQLADGLTTKETLNCYTILSGQKQSWQHIQRTDIE